MQTTAGKNQQAMPYDAIPIVKSYRRLRAELRQKRRHSYAAYSGEVPHHYSHRCF